jgi:hypothetical protein
MNYPPMKFTFVLDGDAATITIRHHVAQSYSRAVDPKATRVFKANHPGGTWALTGADYGTREHAFDQHCVSTYTYERWAA